MTLQGGFTSGSGHRDQCEIWASLPAQATTLGVASPVSACRTDEPWSWNWRGLVSHVVPKVDVQVSGILRSQANVQTRSGIAGGAPTVTLNLAPLGLVYPDRLNTVDMRFTKIVRVGRTRTSIGSISTTC